MEIYLQPFTLWQEDAGGPRKLVVPDFRVGGGAFMQLLVKGGAASRGLS